MLPLLSLPLDLAPAPRGPPPGPSLSTASMRCSRTHTSLPSIPCSAVVCGPQPSSQRRLCASWAPIASLSASMGARIVRRSSPCPFFLPVATASGSYLACLLAGWLANWLAGWRARSLYFSLTCCPDYPFSGSLTFVFVLFSSKGTVLVHIYAAVLRRLSGLSTVSQDGTTNDVILPINAVYIQCPAPFPEVEDFIYQSAKRYNMDVRCINGDMKEALQSYLTGQGKVFVSCPAAAAAAPAATPAPASAPATSTFTAASPSPFPSPAETQQQEQDPPRLAPPNSEYLNGLCQGAKSRVDSSNGPLLPGQEVTAMFIGTRSTDPNGGGLSIRAWTDPGWPQVERIQPVLDWDYKDIWDFLRCPILSPYPRDSGPSPDAPSPGVPYCSLYNQGYVCIILGGEGEGHACWRSVVVRRSVLTHYFGVGVRYTSLGSTFNTFPNPELKESGVDTKGNPRFKPAYLLSSGALERSGRGTASEH